MHHYASHLAHHADADTAVDVAADHIDHELRGLAPTLVIVAASDHFRDEADAVRRAVVRRFPTATIAGAVIPGGVIGVREETERQPAISLLAAVLPAHAAVVFELDHPDELPGDTDTLVLFADPYTLEAERLLDRADRLGVDIVGGFTGGYGAGSARLLTREAVRTAGAVAIRFDLPGVEALVSQGARPVGSDLVITAAEGNVVLELAGKPAAEQLHIVLGSLSPEDLQLARTGLMAGIVIDENRPEYDVGDFLVRGLLGVAGASGGLAVAAEPRVGQTFRFHVRDGDGADHDLRRVLGAASSTAGAALIFACNGRGRHMFEAPHHDANVVADVLDVPLVGGFCQGELGPVAGANHVHAFTATMLTLPL
ncbi:MAG: FIST N-terminal domain-containing protein [Gaiellales bacterium]